MRTVNSQRVERAEREGYVKRVAQPPSLNDISFGGEVDALSQSIAGIAVSLQKIAACLGVNGSSDIVAAVSALTDEMVLIGKRLDAIKDRPFEVEGTVASRDADGRIETIIFRSE